MTKPSRLSSLLEKDVVPRILLALQKLKVTTWRNNTGKLQDAVGRWVTFGLCEGSSDRIGLLEYEVQAKDVGRRIAVFVAIETKRPVRAKRTKEQIHFIEFIKQRGGCAGFAGSPEEAEAIIKKFLAGETT